MLKLKNKQNKFAEILNEIAKIGADQYLLLEGRIEDVKKKYKDKVGEEVIDTFSQNDPSGNNKYLDWMVYQYEQVCKSNYDLPMKFYQPTVKYVISLTRLFHENNNNLQSKDINFYKDAYDLEKELVYIAKPKSNKKVTDKYAPLVVHNDEQFSVVIPRTKEDSCTLGAGTKWCVAARGSGNAFEQYISSSNYDFYFVTDKNRGENDPLYKLAVVFKQGEESPYEIYSAPDYVIAKSHDRVSPANGQSDNIVQPTELLKQHFGDKFEIIYNKMLSVHNADPYGEVRKDVINFRQARSVEDLLNLANSPENIGKLHGRNFLNFSNMFGGLKNSATKNNKIIFILTCLRAIKLSGATMIAAFDEVDNIYLELLGYSSSYPEIKRELASILDKTHQVLSSLKPVINKEMYAGDILFLINKLSPDMIKIFQKVDFFEWAQKEKVLFINTEGVKDYKYIIEIMGEKYRDKIFIFTGKDGKEEITQIVTKDFNSEASDFYGSGHNDGWVELEKFTKNGVTLDTGKILAYEIELIKGDSDFTFVKTDEKFNKVVNRSFHQYGAKTFSFSQEGNKLKFTQPQSDNIQCKIEYLGNYTFKLSPYNVNDKIFFGDFLMNLNIATNDYFKDGIFKITKWGSNVRTNKKTNLTFNFREETYEKQSYVKDPNTSKVRAKSEIRNIGYDERKRLFKASEVYYFLKEMDFHIKNLYITLKLLQDKDIDSVAQSIIKEARKSFEAKTKDTPMQFIGVAKKDFNQEKFLEFYEIYKNRSSSTGEEEEEPDYSNQLKKKSRNKLKDIFEAAEKILLTGETM